MSSVKVCSFLDILLKITGFPGDVDPTLDYTLYSHQVRILLTILKAKFIFIDKMLIFHIIKFCLKKNSSYSQHRKSENIFQNSNLLCAVHFNMSPLCFKNALFKINYDKITMDKKAIWIFATFWYIWKQQQNKSAEDILEVYKSCREIFFLQCILQESKWRVVKLWPLFPLSLVYTNEAYVQVQ